MNDSRDFAPAIAACFDYDNTLYRDKLTDAIRQLFDETQSTPPASKKTLYKRNDELNALTGGCRIALVYGGATKIKDYVFEAPKLPEIRGASALLDWVNEVELPKLWGADSPKQFVEKGIIYASGGGFLAFAPADKGQELATEIERCYTEHTLTANSVAICETFNLLELRYGRRPLDYWIEDFVEDWSDECKRKLLEQYYYPPEGIQPENRSKEALRTRFFNRKTFGELVTLLTTLFYRRREGRASHGEPRSVPFYPMMPWAEKCATSDIRPSVVIAEPLPNNPTLSESSARKAYIGRKVKRPDKAHEWFTEVFDWKLNPFPDPWETRFLRHPSVVAYNAACQDLNQRGITVEAAQDVGEIAQASKPGRYIGLIYADGNNVARYMGVTKTPAEYVKKAQQLTCAAERAVFTALDEHLRPTKVRTDTGTSEWVHPFEILTIGGDDLLLIVPGSKALEIALSIGLSFERSMRDSDKVRTIVDRYNGETRHNHTGYIPQIGLSAGVVIAQEATPIFFLRNLVDQLLKNAKKLARRCFKDSGDGGGAVDFMVMKSITMITNNINTFREEALGDDRKLDETTQRRTARPYTWREFDGLLCTAKALRAQQFPRSQL
ncbi:MAG: hydrolase, partial [Chloroflexales bacterium]|nr:hydrolase [Chloroflexales bacterium]